MCNAAANAIANLSGTRDVGTFSFDGEVSESVLVEVTAQAVTGGGKVADGLTFEPQWTYVQTGASSDITGSDTVTVQANNDFKVHGVMTVTAVDADALAAISSKEHEFTLTASVTYN